MEYSTSQKHTLHRSLITLYTVLSCRHYLGSVKTFTKFSNTHSCITCNERIDLILMHSSSWFATAETHIMTRFSFLSKANIISTDLPSYVLTYVILFSWTSFNPLWKCTSVSSHTQREILWLSLAFLPSSRKADLKANYGEKKKGGTYINFSDAFKDVMVHWKHP